MEHFPDVDAYLAASELWPREIVAVRRILAECDVDEDIKWGKPCYSHNDGNILILQEMKPYLAVMFFKGVLLSDPDGLLHDQGPNSRSARRMQFTSIDEVAAAAESIKAYVAEAVAVEQAGTPLPVADAPVLADELQQRLDDDQEFRAAFEDLTPGRRREYNLHISGAKQAKTRLARLDKVAPKILAGKGFRDR